MAQANRDENGVSSLLVRGSATGADVVVEGDEIHKSINVSPVAGTLVTEAFDYVSMALSGSDTTETYTFKTGGAGGTTVATVVVVYTDDSREVLSTVTKT